MLNFLQPLLPLWGTSEYNGAAVISAAFPYRLPEEYYAGRNVSRYAAVQDYHAVCGARLAQACVLLKKVFPDASFRAACDSSPLPEPALAEQAGLGVRGRHNLLITPTYGSWVFLGEIITSATLPFTKPQAFSPCNQCDACQRACPTGALNNNGFDSKKCISHISQRKGVLTPREEALLRHVPTAWGCDLCQEVCPHNKRARVDPLPEFLNGSVAHVDENTPVVGRAFAWRGEAVIRRNLKALD